MATVTAPQRLHFTGNDEADALIAQEPFALLVGFALDQQVPVPTAFAGPLKLKQRFGTLDPGTIAATDPARLEAIFREKPAVHRIAALPGYGEMKIKALGSVLAKRFGIAVAQGLVPSHPTLGDVDSPQALERYQAMKREYK